MPINIKLIIGFAQAVAPTYSFLDTEDKRRGFVLNLVNKDEDGNRHDVEREELDEIIQEYIDDGTLTFNGHGTVVTSAGFAALAEVKFHNNGKKKDALVDDYEE